MLLVMAVTTYLVRAVPFTLFRRKIKSARVKAFFGYIPYSVLSAMTFPSILYSTGSMLSAAAGTVTALILAYRGKNLLVVALATCAAAFLVSLLEIYVKF